MQQIFIDFETFFDPKDKYSLRSLTTSQYIKDERFLVQCVGIKIGAEKTKVYWYDDIEPALFAIDWDDANVVAHNNAFDAAILAFHYHIYPSFLGCTRSMSAALYVNEESHSLAATAKRLKLHSKKGDELASAAGIRLLDQKTRNSIEAYCINDVELCCEAFDIMAIYFPKNELDLIDLTLRMWTKPMLMLDSDRAKKHLDAVESKQKELVDKSGVAKTTLASNQKFAAYLESLGVDVPKKISPTTEKETFAFGKNDSEFLEMQVKHPELADVIDARLEVKSTIDQSRTKRFIEHAQVNDQFMPIPLRYWAASTGRWGGSDKLNFQNLPRGGELRKCLIAPPGFVILAADSSNIEARVLAWLAGQSDLLAEFRNGEDVYANLASQIYNHPVDKESDPTKRFVGKTATLGLGYQMGWRRFQQTLAVGALGPRVFLNDDECLKVVNTYRSSRFRIKNLWYEMQAAIDEMINPQGNFLIRGFLPVQRESIILPNNMKLRYPNLRNISEDDNFQTVFGENKINIYGGKLTENVIQALARLIIAEQMLAIDDVVTSVGGRVVMTVHDEVVSVVPKEVAEAMQQEIIEIMRTPPEWAIDLPLDAEAGFAKEYSK